MIHAKKPECRFNDITHFLPLYRAPKRVQRLMASAPGSISVRTVQKIGLVNLFEHSRHRPLNQLVLETWYA
jgi:hypothetical protein